jgi:hypothetical protein
MAMILGSSSTIAADYSVGIVGLGTRVGGGTAINLYRITQKKVELVQDYIAQEVDTMGQLVYPLALAVNPAHDFVYVAYTGTGLNGSGEPNIVGFKITPQGLVKEWEQRLETGDHELQGTTLVAQKGYLIENTHPSGGLWVHVLAQSGQEVVSDNGGIGYNLASGHTDPHGELYYSCRYPGVNGPANTVVVYDLDSGRVNDTTPPLLASTDPTFVQSICN